MGPHPRFDPAQKIRVVAALQAHGEFVAMTGSGVVVGAGMATELGRIAALLAAEEDIKTPLQKRLAVFGRRLAIAVLAVCAVILIAGLLRGLLPESPA